MEIGRFVGVWGEGLYNVEIDGGDIRDEVCMENCLELRLKA